MSQITISKSLAAKALAILAVIMLHIESTLPWSITRTSYTQELSTALDQLNRFSVPVFIFLSGYGLSVSTKTPIKLIDFYKRRFIRIIPAYIFWSIIIYILLSVIPEWNTSQNIAWHRLPTVLILGQADYHLYFIPVIIMYYLVFPLGYYLNQHHPRKFLTSAFLLQALYLVVLHLNLIAEFFPQWQNSDYWQYFNPLAWIGYFGLGISLSSEVFSQEIKKISRYIPWLILFSYCILVINAIFSIYSGTDPLLAQKFTRIPVMAYATVFCLWIYSGKLWQTLSENKVLVQIGIHSLTIYYVHTLVIRVVSGLIKHQISWESTGYVFISILLAAYIQHRLKLA